MESNRIAITITLDDIRDGSRSDPKNDAFSKAIKRATGHSWAMAGWGYATTYNVNGEKFEWTIEDAGRVESWLKLWDSNRMVPYTNFYMTLDRKLPKPLINQAGKPKHYKSFAQSQEYKKT